MYKYILKVTIGKIGIWFINTKWNNIWGSHFDQIRLKLRVKLSSKVDSKSKTQKIQHGNKRIETKNNSKNQENSDVTRYEWLIIDKINCFTGIRKHFIKNLVVNTEELVIHYRQAMLENFRVSYGINLFSTRKMWSS